ncbi:MAG TPA: glycerophosphodiester phosphodiesterase, partial [Enterococcus faecalis]|nr:glycerophosphodiester phosphodiesterase [Enterococcus faecalis]
MFSYFKNSIVNTLDFLKGTTAYFRDVLLMHGFMLFVLLPLLTSLSKLVLKEGGIDYISYDNLGAIATQHPYVLLTFLLIGLLILLALFFEFTFLLLSVYFIKKKQPITLTQLLHGTLLQIKKVRGITFLFFLAYFFLILPLSGLTFRSYLLTRVKIPAFILDFIFANRVIIIIGFVLLELIILYLAIRLAFALPELILRDVGFRESLKRSWQITKRRFFQILGQFIIIGGTVLGIFTAGYFLIFLGQTAVETFKPEWSLPSAVIAMTLLQVMMLLNLVLSSVAIFYIIVDDMEDEGILPDTPEWFTPKSEVRVEWTTFRVVLFCLIAIIFGIGVGTYNTNYLSHTPDRKPVTISHRGVNGNNGVQNTLDSLIETNKAKPDYVEMDIQETKDH